MPHPIIEMAPIVPDLVRSVNAFMTARSEAETRRHKQTLERHTLVLDKQLEAVNVQAKRDVDIVRVGADRDIEVVRTQGQRDILIEFIAMARSALDKKIDAVVQGFVRALDGIEHSERIIAEQLRRIDDIQVREKLTPFQMSSLMAQGSELRLNHKSLTIMRASLTLDYFKTISGLAVDPDVKALAKSTISRLIENKPN